MSLAVFFANVAQKDLALFCGAQALHTLFPNGHNVQAFSCQVWWSWVESFGSEG